MKRIGALSILLAFCSVDVAQAQPNGGFGIEGQIGYSMISMGDINDSIEQMEDIFRSVGIYKNFKKLDGGINLVGRGTFQPTTRIGLGLEVSYLKDKATNNLADVSGSFLYSPVVSLVEIAPSIRVYFPMKKQRMYIGALGGVGLGKFSSKFSAVDYSDPTVDLQIQSEADGSGLVLGGFVGYRLTAGTANLSIEGGYKYRDLGEFEGRSVSPQRGISEGTLQIQGFPVDMDYSGAYLRAGIGFGS